MGEEIQNLESAIRNIRVKTETVLKWVSSSGLKINETKTEICIFHRANSITMDIIIDNTRLTSTNTVNLQFRQSALRA